MKALRVVIIVICVLAVILFGVAWYFSSMLLYVAPEKCTKAHFVYCNDPSEIGLDFKNVEFKTSDGLTLRGWYIPAVNSSKAVAMLHGHGADRHEAMRMLRHLHEAGLNLLTFDFRSAGKSEGKVNSMGYLERRDVKAAVDFLVTTMKMKSIGVFGVSQGGFTGILAMAEDPRIKAGLFEASYADVTDIVAEVGKRDFNLPRYPLIPIVFWLYQLRGGFTIDTSAEKVIGTISPRPIYLIHCRGDKFTAYSHMERLMKASKEPRQFWTPACTEHAEAWQFDRSYMEKSVTEFFKKNLR